MNKRGFVFIETVVVIIVLTSSLLLLYSTFFNILQTEKTRIYYDDINYIYRAIHIRNELLNYDLASVVDDEFKNNSESLIKVVGTDNLKITNPNDVDYYQGLISDFEVNKILILKNDDASSVKIKKCVLNNSYSNECNDLNLVASDDMISYIKSMYVNVSANYIMLFEFNSCDKNNHCRNYYSWIKVDL